MGGACLALASLTALAAWNCSPPDPALVVTCQLDDQPPTPCSSPVSYDGLPPGRHVVVVRASRLYVADDGTPTLTPSGEDSWEWDVLPDGATVAAH